MSLYPLIRFQDVRSWANYYAFQGSKRPNRFAIEFELVRTRDNVFRRQFVSCAAFAQKGLIRVSEGQFVDDNCDPFYFSGYNTWQVSRRRQAQPFQLRYGH